MAPPACCKRCSALIRVVKSCPCQHVSIHTLMWGGQRWQRWSPTSDYTCTIVNCWFNIQIVTSARNYDVSCFGKSGPANSHSDSPPDFVFYLIQYQNLSRERVNPALSSSVCDSKYSAKCARSSYALMQLWRVLLFSPCFDFTDLLWIVIVVGSE